MLLFSEVRADGLLFLLLIFSICSPVKSDNIDFGMDFFFLSHSLKHTHTHTVTVSNVYRLHLNLCALVMKHSTFMQLTLTLCSSV